jgi:hypothetical protein
VSTRDILFTVHMLNLFSYSAAVHRNVQKNKHRSVISHLNYPELVVIKEFRPKGGIEKVLRRC